MRGIVLIIRRQLPEETLFVARRWEPLLEDSVSGASFSASGMTTNSLGGRKEPLGIRREIQAKPAERLSEHQQRSYTEYSLKTSKNYRLVSPDEVPKSCQGQVN